MLVLTLPSIRVSASQALRDALGDRVRAAATTVLGAVFSDDLVAIACRQIRFDGVPVAFSLDRRNAAGDLLLTLDLGVATLANRRITEAEMREAEASARSERKKRRSSAFDHRR